MIFPEKQSIQRYLRNQLISGLFVLVPLTGLN